jgi:hypothetical protein
MKTVFIVVIGLLTFFAVVFSLQDYLKNNRTILDDRSRQLSNGSEKIERVISTSIGKAANGAYLTAVIDLIVNQFGYKIGVTDSGCLRTQVDFLFTKSTPLKGPIFQLTGDVVVGSASPTMSPFVEGTNYTNGTYNNVTLKNLSGSMKGSGALAYLKVEGGAVKKASITTSGSGYAKDDILTPCFTFADSTGAQTGCRAQPAGSVACQLKVATIKQSTVQNAALDDPVWLDTTTVRDIGPGAEYAANESQAGINLTYIGQTYRTYYNGKCEVAPISNNAQNQWFCVMDEFAVKKNSKARDLTRFRSMTILAQTSEKNDLHVYYLLLTYSGLGILTAPRGAIITVDLFETGYTDLFTELGHPRCGQTSDDIPLNGLPGLGLTDFNNYVCGLGCALYIPPTSADVYDVLIWELASPNGLYRIQFFDSGHFRFISVGPSGPLNKVSIVAGGSNYAGPLTVNLLKFLDTQGSGVGATASLTVASGVITGIQIIARGTGYAIGDRLKIAGSSAIFEVYQINSVLDPVIFETAAIGQDLDFPTKANMYYPTCSDPKVSVSLVPTKKLLVSRDGWVIQGATFNLDRDGTLISIPSLDLMVQITDAGALVLQKDYKYGTDVQNSHIVNQSAIGRIIPTDPLTQLGPTNDSSNKHWALGNALACYGGESSNLGGFFDLANGAVLAQTNIFSDSSAFGNGRYILWLSHYGLRLLYANSVSAQLLQDMTKSLWITPFYFNWWYRGGSASNNLFTTSTVCRTNNFPNWPLPSLAVNGSSGGGNPKINTCGFFRKPSTATPGNVPEKPILLLSSKNKRFQFRMMNSGRCMLLDTRTPMVPLFTTDAYTQVTNLNQCP